MPRLVLYTLVLALLMQLQPRQLRAQKTKTAPADSEPKIYNPPPAWKSVDIGDFYLRKRSYRAALSRYQEAARIDPYYARAFLGMGRVYDRLGLRQKALDNYRKYLDLLPSSKQAEEAKEVHKAIERLERQVGATQPAAPTH